MTDEQFRILTRDLNGATLTPKQERQLKQLTELAETRGAKAAALFEAPSRTAHDGEVDWQ